MIHTFTTTRNTPNNNNNNMAWPGNHYSSFWENMYGPNNNQPNGAHGAGVDHAPPPPPPELPQFMNPDFWNNWAHARHAHPNAARHAFGQHGHAHAHGGRHHAHGGRHAHGQRGGRHGRGGSGEDEPAERNGGPVTDSENDETFPPEYISDDEVAAATAAAEVQEKRSGKDRSGSPDTMMRDGAEDPPEEVPNPDESPRHRGFGRHGHRGRGGFGRGGFGHEGFGPHRRGGRHGARHHGGGPGPFGGMPGGGPCRRRSHGPHGKGHGGHPREPPFAFFEHFFGPPRGGPHHGPGPHHRGPPPPPGAGPEGPGPEGPGPFDFRAMLGALSGHPYAQHMREFWERNNNNNRGVTPDSSDNEEEDNDMASDSTTPPLDLFELADRWVLHLAVPGAKKEDVGVQWDADRSVLRIAGVVHRPGDEALLQGLVSGERRVGLFSREVRLPPLAPADADEKAKEEVNGDGISAKMEDGVLVVTVPKMDREWTEVKRVEIQ